MGILCEKRKCRSKLLKDHIIIKLAKEEELSRKEITLLIVFPKHT